MDHFIREITLSRSDVSALWTEFQAAAGQHIDSLGLGTERWPALMWVIVRQKMVFFADVPTGRPLTLCTWMGQARHDFFPRHHALYDGETLLCRAAAVWAMVDVTSRTFGKAPQEMYDAVTRREEGELPRLMPLRALKEGQKAAFTVREDYIDTNGHMNNACYFTAVEAALPAMAGPLREVQVDYLAEALLGERVELLWQEEEGVRTIAGRKGDKGCFRMKLTY